MHWRDRRHTAFLQKPWRDLDHSGGVTSAHGRHAGVLRGMSRRYRPILRPAPNSLSNGGRDCRSTSGHTELNRQDRGRRHSCRTAWH